MTGLQHLGVGVAGGGPVAIIIVWFMKLHGVNMPVEVAAAINSCCVGVYGLAVAFFQYQRGKKSVHTSN